MSTSIDDLLKGQNGQNASMDEILQLKFSNLRLNLHNR